MPQISRTTNPTGLKKLDAKLFGVRVQNTSSERSFWLEKFDVAMSGLPTGLQLSCIAHCGNTEEFFKLGTVDKPDLSVKPLRNLATNKPLKFRFVVHALGDPKLVAFADGVRAADDAGLLGGSLVDIDGAARLAVVVGGQRVVGRQRLDQARRDHEHQLRLVTLELGDLGVPIFVAQGDKVEIDTRTGEYRKRV